MLPPSHRLPWFQSVFPTYDRYAVPLLVQLCEAFERPVLVDVGANVGDTTLLALDAVDRMRAVAVEGDENFMRYLQRNLAPVSESTVVVPRFVLPPGVSGLEYSSDGSTGSFRVGAPTVGYDGISIQELLDLAQGDLVIWKSDTDGLDVTLLLAGWNLISARCAVVWFELDPRLDVDGGRGIPALISTIARSGRTVLVFDNHGSFVDAFTSEAAAEGLQQLLASLRGPHRGITATQYFDVWALDPARVSVPRI